MENLMIKINVSNLSDEQLHCLIFDAQNEQERRKNAQKREAWKKVMDAISEYIDNFGDILVKDDGGFLCIALDEYYTTSKNYHTYGRLMPDYSEEDEDDDYDEDE